MIRLIDAYALEKWLTTNKANVNPLDYNTKATYAECITMVKAMETIDAEPVQHGENVSGVHPTDEFLCSRFGFSCEITELRRDECGMGEANCYEYDCKYCPDCGAKMDGGAEDG